MALPYSLPIHHSLSPGQAEAVQRANESVSLGEAKLKSGDDDGAIGAFQQVLVNQPHDGLALQRLAEAYTAKGQTDRAIATYRTLLYPVPGQHWGSSNATSPTVLMHFALLLLQTGQGAEALTAYHRAVYFLDYDMGQPKNEPLLPDLGSGPGQEPYTPQALQAMAYLAIGIDTPGFDAAELRQAVKLAPDSAAAQYYLGKSLLGRDPVAAKAALQKAVQLGDDRTAQAAQVYLKVLR